MSLSKGSLRVRGVYEIGVSVSQCRWKRVSRMRAGKVGWKGKTGKVAE